MPGGASIPPSFPRVVVFTCSRRVFNRCTRIRETVAADTSYVSAVHLQLHASCTLMPSHLFLPSLQKLVAVNDATAEELWATISHLFVAGMFPKPEGVVCSTLASKGHPVR